MHPDDVFAATEPLEPSGAPPARNGEVLGGRFELERVVGRGGMGAVWRARDRRTDEPVAVKILLNQNEQQVVRFQREARLLSELKHPGIARHIAHGVTDDGRHYLAMEWLEGEDLAERLRREPLGVDESLLLVEGVADALGEVHARQIVHRDIKPANIFLPHRRIDEVKVLDFGIAREPDPVVLTAEGLLVGTPAYMSPEQAQGDPNIDPRSDVFSLGCVLYECLTQAPAFDGPHALAVLAKVMVSDPVPVAAARQDVPPPVAALLDSMLSKKSVDRLPEGATVASLARLARAGLDDRSDRAAVAFGRQLMAALGREMFSARPKARLVYLSDLEPRSRSAGDYASLHRLPSADWVLLVARSDSWPSRAALAAIPYAAHRVHFPDGSFVILLKNMSFDGTPAPSTALALVATLDGTPVSLARVGRGGIGSAIDRAAKVLDGALKSGLRDVVVDVESIQHIDDDQLESVPMNDLSVILRDRVDRRDWRAMGSAPRRCPFCGSSNVAMAEMPDTQRSFFRCVDCRRVVR